MEAFELLWKYIDFGVAGMLLLQMIMLLAVIFMVRRLSRYVRKIHKNVQNYIEAIMEDDTETEAERVESPHIMSGQERQMMETISQKKKQQEEEVFNAVLQEIFP